MKNLSKSEIDKLVTKDLKIIIQKVEDKNYFYVLVPINGYLQSVGRVSNTIFKWYKMKLVNTPFISIQWYKIQVS
jgi:hypothetical protein